MTARSGWPEFHRGARVTPYLVRMPDSFDDAISSLRAIAFEATPRISITLDLTGVETPVGQALSSLSVPPTAPELSIIHRPDDDDAEAQFIMRVLSLLAEPA